MRLRKTILLIEDDESDEILALRTIRNSGLRCEVIVARDGESALQILETPPARFDLVLLDLNLPRISGLELLEMVRETQVDAPIVVFSSSNEEAGVRAARELGASSYVRKEIDFALYESRLRVLLYYWLTIHESCPAGQTIAVDAALGKTRALSRI